MKKFIPAAALAALTALAACNQQSATKSSSSEPSKKSSNPEIVYVNSDSLLNNYAYFKEMRDKLEDKGKKAQSDLSSRGQAFQREVAEYQKSAGTMTAEQRQSTEQRLARKQQELQSYNQNTSLQIQKEESDEQQKLYDKVADYLKGYAKQKGYKMVLTYQRGNSTVLFADSTLDVTTEVLKGLNDAHAKAKK
ncbi:MAG: OmpH family outer membrane protein [Mucilaginibacter polytrichastri]|nr:OmpH family outer membrane protein [Mucilaginibacter polytrichastri]